jgi:hypothetical protein
LQKKFIKVALIIACASLDILKIKHFTGKTIVQHNQLSGFNVDG